MLYLSVSALRDYLSCPKRYWYRVYRKASAEINEYVERGQIVHNAIEKYNNYKEAIAFADGEYSKKFINDKVPDEVSKMLRNYYEEIEPLLGFRGNDNVEYMFKVRWSPSVFIVGKIDRMSKDKTRLYDWKTTYKKPSLHSLQDPQFYVYHWAVSRKFGVKPEVYYGHLMSGKLFRVDINEKMWYNVKYLIDEVANELRDVKYFPRVPGYQCGSCFFKNICWSEFGNE